MRVHRRTQMILVIRQKCIETITVFDGEAELLPCSTQARTQMCKKLDMLSYLRRNRRSISFSKGLGPLRPIGSETFKELCVTSQALSPDSRL